MARNAYKLDEKTLKAQLPAYTGELVFVDSAIGNAGGDGSSLRPFATVDAAISASGRSAGDMIVVAPDHAETLDAAGDITIDVAGITIFCLGQGDVAPTFTFDGSDATPSISVTASDCKWVGGKFVNNEASLNHMFDIAGDDFTIEDAFFTEGSATGLSFITADTADGDSDRLLIKNCRFYAPTAGNYDNAISLAKDHVGVRIEGCDIYGDFDDAGISVPAGGNACLDLAIRDCRVVNLQSGDHAIEINGTSCTGEIVNCRLGTDAKATAIDTGSLRLYNVLWQDTTDDSIAQPVFAEPDSTTNILGANDADNGFVSTSVIINDNGSVLERLEGIRATQGIPLEGLNPLGTTYYVASSGGSDSATGDSPDAPLATIAQAITNASAGDNVVLGPGTHSVDVSAAALAPKADMTFIAAVPPKGGKPSTIITHDADDGADLVLIDVDGVTFKGVEFLLVAGGTTAIRTVAVSQTTAVTGLTFEDCWFNLNDVDGAGVMALAVNDATNATTGLTVRGCRFLGGAGTTNQISYIQIGVGGSVSGLFERNVFELESADADCYGFDFLDNAAAANKSYANIIRENDFMGPLDGGEDGVGIFIASALTEKEILSLVRNNYFAYCAAPPVTIDKMNKGFINNYVGDDATGGTLVDPGT